jgi:hypothetical protein
LIRMLSSSSQVSLDNPSKVIGRELLEQKIMHESSSPWLPLHQSMPHSSHGYCYHKLCLTKLRTCKLLMLQSPGTRRQSTESVGRCG